MTRIAATRIDRALSPIFLDPVWSPAWVAGAVAATGVGLHRRGAFTADRMLRLTRRGLLVRWVLHSQARIKLSVAELGGTDVTGRRQIPRRIDRRYGHLTDKRAVAATWNKMSRSHHFEALLLCARVRTSLRRVAGSAR